MVPEKIVVKKAVLLIALEALTMAAKGKNPPQLVVYTIDGFLFLRVGVLLRKVPASGYLRGVGRLFGRIIQNLKEFLPDSEEITITQLEDRIAFGNSKLSCVWDTHAKPEKDPIELMFTHVETLTLRYKYPIEEIRNSGYEKELFQAEEEKNRLIYLAINALSYYKIEYSQIATLVNEFILKSLSE